MRKNLPILIIAYCLLLPPMAIGAIGTHCHAQEILLPPQARLLTRFPFKQYSGGVMVVQAKFANIPDSLNFILDTGSGGISLDSATCAELNIATTATDTSITGIGGVRKVPFVFDKTLHFPNLEVKHLNFHVNNYEVLTSVYGEKVDGIIGYSFFSRYIVAINFDSNYIEVYNPGKISYPREGTTLHPVFTALPIQWVNIRDKKKLGYNYYFDTGAGLCFLLSEQFAADSSILLSRRKPVLTQAQGMGGKLQMRLTVVKEIKIGPYRFRHVPTYLYDDQYNVTSFPFTGGLIGNDLLRRFNMVLNYPKREIHLTPNRYFTEPFDYAYTGLGIYYVEGKIMVEDVIEGSPAAKAKFMVGDEIFSVNNNFSHNIMAYKTILQSPNEDIKVIVQRNKELVILHLHTLSIR
jgi:Aspartyl protease